MCARRTQVFIGVRSTFRGVRRCASGGVLRNPNRPRFIGRQPETREAKGDRARQQDSSPARIHVYPIDKIPEDAPDGIRRLF